MEFIASILTTLFYMAFILALISLVLPAKFYETRNKSRKQSVLIWLGFALLFFVGISFFAPSVPLRTEKPVSETAKMSSHEDSVVPGGLQETLPPEREEKNGKEDRLEGKGEKLPGEKTNWVSD